MITNEEARQIEVLRNYVDNKYIDQYDDCEKETEDSSVDLNDYVTLRFADYHRMLGGDPTKENWIDEYNLDECDCDLKEGTIIIPFEEYRSLVRRKINK